MMESDHVAQLAADLEEWGAVAVGMKRDELRTLLPSRRADRLFEWLRTHGSLNPTTTLRSKPRSRQIIPRSDGVRTHLVVGDCHAAPRQDLRRFGWLAKLVNDVKPDVMVQIGDWYSLDSLCSHSSTAERSGENTREDLKAGELALEVFHAGLKHECEKHFTIGNHDVRIHDIAEDEPWLAGLFNVGAAHEARGWKVHPFNAPVRVDGVRYQHYLTNSYGKAIGGKYQPARMLERVRNAESVVVGHSHRLEFRTEADHLGGRVCALVAGCYLEHVEEYAGPDNWEWWRGVCVLRVRDGAFDLETISMARIEELYG